MGTTGKDKKCYVLLVSRTFPSTHKRAGQSTHFVDNIFKARKSSPPSWMPCNLTSDEILKLMVMPPKLHTIRLNYALWAARFAEIEAGTAYLSVRYWEGKPFKSKQKEFIRLHNTDGIGIQKLTFSIDAQPVVDEVLQVQPNDYETLANNDGLSREDFYNWFGDNIYFYNPDPYVIIHFTKFRYEKENQTTNAPAGSH